ncbi:MAG: hypothetical protein WAV93_02700 [Bacteroidales bacterium]
MPGDTSDHIRREGMTSGFFYTIFLMDLALALNADGGNGPRCGFVPAPMVIILVGTDAISGGIFEGSPALNRRFIETHTPDLYVPGNPAHPLTFINGVMDLLGI